MLNNAPRSKLLGTSKLMPPGDTSRTRADQEPGFAGATGGAGPDRLTAAALRGVPQVIVLGALDAIHERQPFGERWTAYHHGVRYARTTLEENDHLGREIAHKASAARGPTAVLVPRHGLSALDVDAGPFWRPEADAALVQSLKNWFSPHVRVHELKMHVNDLAFVFLF